jgi:DNA polymerase-3 subunit alpha
LDDEAAFEVLNKQKWAGIFQWNGHALQSLTAQTVVKEFEDVVSITALARPGPLNSGGATQWIDRKNGAESVTYPHPLFEPSLKTSLGIVIYQEQVMQIGREVGGLDWDDVTALRKAMSKSLGKEFFDQYGDKFKRGAIERALTYMGLTPGKPINDISKCYGIQNHNKHEKHEYRVKNSDMYITK